MAKNSFILTGLVALLKPIASFCVRNGLKLNDVIECLKSAFIQAAQESGDAKELPSKSQLSIMTGIHRRDIARLTSANEPELRPIDDVTTRVLGRWQTDRQFQTKGGLPKPLTFDGEKSEFAHLVSLVTKDVRYKILLAELERSKAIERSDSVVYVSTHSYTPTADLARKFQILSVDEDALIRAAEDNITSTALPRNLQARTEFDCIRAESRDEILHWMLNRGHQLHSEAREFLSRHDQEINPKADYKGPVTKVLIGTFGYVFQKKQ